MAVSPGGLVATATGLSALTRQVRRLVAGLGLASFSAAVSSLPHDLRRACAEARAYCRAIRADYEVELACGLIGPCDGEMRGVIFAEAANFEPTFASSWLSPDVGGALPATAQAVLETAQRQVRLIRARHYPDASGRMLTIARVGADRVVTRRVPLLIGDERAA